ncbi:MAG TPA: hypothetical protein VJZ00_17660 [Thermoanaerobaculia bacterium]|nr:hypothetical protein [Thermoanaerobaculia bacterium]
MRSRVVLAILFAAAAWTSLPRMTRASIDAFHLARLPYEQRRDSFCHSIQRIRAQLHDGEMVGISMRDPSRDAGAAVFANYYLYPHPTRFYRSLDDYRRTVIDNPSQPKKFVRLDLGRTHDARLMTYLEIRAEEVAESPVVRNPKPSADAHRELVVPMALALDGQPGNAYLTEGVLESDADAQVTLTFFPSGESKTFALRAHEPLILRDVVYTITSRLDAGWLHMTSSTPARAAFWFVNRRLKHAVPLQLFEQMPSSPQHVTGGEKLFVLNPADHAIEVDVNGEARSIAAHALATLASAPQNTITANEPFLAFSTRKENGREILQWP